MTADESFRIRLRQAHKALEMRLGRDFGQDEIGEQIGMLRKGRPVPQGTVSRWFRGTIPALETICHLSTVLGVDCGWLAFGESSKAPKPDWITPTSNGNGGVDQSPTVRQALRQVETVKAQRKPDRHRKSG